MGKKGLSLLIIAGCLGGSILGAGFDFPSSLIRIPTVKDFEGGAYEISSSTAIYSGAYEFDFHGNYAFSNNLVAGATLMNSSNLVGHIHYQFLNTKDFGVGTGILNITANPKPSSFDEINMTRDTSFSPYIVARNSFSDINLHYGLGARYFQKTSTGSATLNGGFIGLDFPMIIGRGIIEFDGIDSHVGIRMPLMQNSEFMVAFTELGIPGTVNANYNNAPKRSILLGFRIRESAFASEKQILSDITDYFAKLDALKTELEQTRNAIRKELAEYKKSREILEKELNDLKNALRDEQRYLFDANLKEKKEKHRKTLETDSIMGERVVKLYFDSFEYYYQGEYNKAIEALTQAIIIDPDVALIHNRLGSVYFELGMVPEALIEWQKSLELDPHNTRIRDLVNRIIANQ